MNQYIAGGLIGAIAMASAMSLEQISLLRDIHREQRAAALYRNPSLKIIQGDGILQVTDKFTCIWRKPRIGQWKLESMQDAQGHFVDIYPNVATLCYSLYTPNYYGPKTFIQELAEKL